MKNGVVKWFSERKGYGFLTGEDGTDVYFNAKCGPKNAKPPKEGDSIQYEEAVGNKGLWAKSWRMPDRQAGSSAVRPPVGPVWDTRAVHPARRRYSSRVVSAR